MKRNGGDGAGQGFRQPGKHFKDSLLRRKYVIPFLWPASSSPATRRPALTRSSPTTQTFFCKVACLIFMRIGDMLYSHA